MNKVKSAKGKVQSDLEQRVADLENQLKRAVADYQNLEKRVSEGRSELTNYVGAEIIRKLIPTLDHLEASLSGPGLDGQSESNGWAKGVELAVKQFKDVLKSEGLEEIVAMGVFDPTLHEAVDTREGKNDIILEVVRKGYNLNGKVLRPAQVIVGRKSNDHPEQAERVEGSN